MNLKPEEISSVIKEQIKQYSTKFEVADTGTVIQVADGITRIHGLAKAMEGELLEFPSLSSPYFFISSTAGPDSP